MKIFDKFDVKLFISIINELDFYRKIKKKTISTLFSSS